ncbi:MAG: 23S rRNA (pseudouridine(1915)-N(3))-methyltransferase RlmH [Eubacteriales bacterium]|nr:23S rRNA (pseudouridine(1915)-N(3))-methyltransferase RlmH [Eubacteriales bacterium]
MKINVICIGKLKEAYWRDAVKEYMKRLGAYSDPVITELKESKLPANASPADEENVKVNEGKEILAKIKPSDYVITLEIKGKRLTSPGFADKIDELQMSGADVDFVIGGSLGLSKEVSARSNYKMSFSDMTFPHQMMRVILLEQIYRGFKIIHHEPYHK